MAGKIRCAEAAATRAANSDSVPQDAENLPGLPAALYTLRPGPIQLLEPSELHRANASMRPAARALRRARVGPRRSPALVRRANGRASVPGAPDPDARTRRTQDRSLALNRKLIVAGLVAAPALAMTMPAAAQEADCDGLDRPVVFAGLDWDSNSFNNGIAGFILEHGYGCDVDVIPGSTIPLLNGMIRGDIDITMEMWIPNVRDAWEAAEEDGTVAAVGTSYPDATQQWFVPRYLVEGEGAPAPDLVSVDDLPRYKDLFADPEQPDKGRFYNCILGWGCEVMNTKKLIAYGLTEDFTNFRPGTGGALAAAIESAILREQPIVFYYWGPTWVLGKVNDQVVALEEPAYDEKIWNALSEMDQEAVTADTPATAYPTVEVSIAVNTAFEDDAPTVIDFLGEYELDAATISRALAYMQDEGASAGEAAEWWLANNEDVWSAWVSDEVAERVSAALAAS
jgi:glycine betaine/proline transport system substrate-binding protein